MNTKKLLFLGVILSSFLAKAADIKVDGNGNVPNSYTTIQAGIDAASDGDRIIIYMECQQYTEGSITVDKSLTFLNAVPGELFTISSKVNLEPGNGREITFVGGSFDSTITATGANTGTNATRVSFSDCIFNNEINTGYDKWTLNLYKNDTYHDVIMTAGEVIGNNFYCTEYATNSTKPRLSVVQETTNLSGDHVRIIANKFSILATEDLGFGSESMNYYWAVSNRFVIMFDNSNKAFEISNNLILGHTRLVKVLNCDSDSLLNKFQFNDLKFITGNDITDCSSEESHLVILKNTSRNGVTNNTSYSKSVRVAGYYPYGDNYSCQLTPYVGAHNNFSDYEGSSLGFPADKLGQIEYCQKNRNQNGQYGFGANYGIYETSMVRNGITSTGFGTGNAQIIDLEMPSVIYSTNEDITVKAKAIHLR